MIVASGCAGKNIYVVANETWCMSFDPIYGHEDDTDKTLEQLETYMDLYTYFCKEGGTNGNR